MMKENWVYCRGDIYCAKLDPVVGSEQGGIRPVIVIQNDTGNKHAPTLIVATVTTRIHKKANMPTHFVIYDNPAFKEASVVQLEQIRTIDKSMTRNTWLHFLHRRLYDGGNEKTHEYVCSGNGQDARSW